MRKGVKTRLVIYIILIVISFCFTVQAQPNSPVYVAPVKGTIDGGSSTFINRVYDEAEENNAAAVILEIDTPGGYIWAAIEMKKRIHSSSVPTIAFVEEGAISAGALIALVSKNLVMAPGSTMGAAEPQVGGERADAKTLSYWAAQLEAAAEENGRDKLVARAMADVDVEIPDLVAKGELLTLTPQRALDLGMIDNILSTRQEVLEEYNLLDNPVIELKPDYGEYFSSLITNPYISTILLTVGIAGLILEIFTVGFGIPGTIALISLGLYFAGHILAGTSGFEAILLFILGIILLGAEVLFIPGFGIAGLGGIVALVTSIILVSPSVNQGITSLVIAIIATIAIVGISIKFLPTRKVWKRLILGDKQTAEEGYNAPTTSLKDLVGQEGIALTPLRPSGAVEIDGKRIDVVTQGSFITPGTRVKVVNVEGTRVIVEKI